MRGHAERSGAAAHAGADKVLAQWCQNNASRMMMGNGTPKSQSRMPRPNPMSRSFVNCQMHTTTSRPELGSSTPSAARKVKG
jgi:hypothetical protein